eukprot:4708702-Pleurochrysis_carterae.AAC.2
MGAPSGMHLVVKRSKSPGRWDLIKIKRVLTIGAAVIIFSQRTAFIASNEPSFCDLRGYRAY